MVMLNTKTYAPSSYVGSPRFTRMEKSARTTFSDGEKYPTTKEVRLLLQQLQSSFYNYYDSNHHYFSK